MINLRSKKLCMTQALPLVLFASASVASTNIPLQNATATYSQMQNIPGYTDLWNAGNTIDGNSSTGWAVARCWPADGAQCTNTYALFETIVWQTVSDVSPSTPLEFKLNHGGTVASPEHNLGRFRLSYTTDDRSMFADGLNQNGDVSANWTWIDILPGDINSNDLEMFTHLTDKSILVSGGNNNQAIYTLQASILAIGITGFRLEALEDSSLPPDPLAVIVDTGGGPGREPSNGNFVLSEFSVAAVPEPGTWLLMLAGLGLLAASIRPSSKNRS